MVVNTILVGSGLYALHAAPSRNVKLSPREDGLILYGENKFGIKSLKIFKNWEELSAFLKSQSLSLPILSYAEKSQAVNVNWESLNPYARWTPYKVTWIGQGGPNVLYTPDEESARIFARYLKYQNLLPAHLGYSLSLKN